MNHAVKKPRGRGVELPGPAAFIRRSSRQQHRGRGVCNTNHTVSELFSKSRSPGGNSWSVGTRGRGNGRVNPRRATRLHCPARPGADRRHGRGPARPVRAHTRTRPRSPRSSTGTGRWCSPSVAVGLDTMPTPMPRMLSRPCFSPSRSLPGRSVGGSRYRGGCIGSRTWSRSKLPGGGRVTRRSRYPRRRCRCPTRRSPPWKPTS